MANTKKPFVIRWGKHYLRIENRGHGKFLITNDTLPLASRFRTKGEAEKKLELLRFKGATILEVNGSTSKAA